MAKDPAFLFYPADWVTGTMGMSFEEKGAYMELLMMQFSRGHMTSHMVGQVVGQIWDKISHKFKKDKDGLWYNERLDVEKTKRKAFTTSRNNNLTGKNQYTKEEGHMTPHMVNVNLLDSNKPNTVIESNGTWENEKKYFLNAEQWQMKQCATFSLSKDALLGYINTFLAKLENQEDYKSEKELKKHFPNWYERNKDKLNGSANGSAYQQDLQQKVKDFQKHVIRD